MKRILKSDLDKFYTKPDLAKRLISRINLDEFDIVLDPSCGSGAFYSNINHKNKIGIDILPHIDGVISHDFLTWSHSDMLGNKVLSITNPPFGKQGSLAMKFFNKCSQFSDTIAFILPLSFAKPSVKNKIPENFHLVYEEILDEASYLLDDEDYSVKCVFQVWTKSDRVREKILSTKETGFKYTKNPQEANLSVRRVGVYAGKAFSDVNKSTQSHYFIILDNPDSRDKLIDELNKKTWQDLTVGPRSISKGELNEVINSIL
jgi:hypothetical protein